MAKGWAVVTGASSGIGESLAKMLAARGHPILLVARRRERLEKLAAALPTETAIVCADLSLPEGVRAVVEAVQGRDLEILINNAGFGGFCAFPVQKSERVSEMVRLNVLAVVELTHALLPMLLARGDGRIVNIASVAAFFRVPGMSLYGATKEFVVSFSLALDAEVRGQGVSVTAVCPGPVETEFNENAGISVRTSRLVTLTADECARFALRAMDARRGIAVPHPVMKLGAVASRLIPSQLGPRVTLTAMKWVGLARTVGLS